MQNEIDDFYFQKSFFGKREYAMYVRKKNV